MRLLQISLGIGLLLVPLASGQEGFPIPLEADDAEPAWSPDGQRLVFASNRQGTFDLWSVGWEGGEPRRLTKERSDEREPAWSPDGKRIAYAAIGDIWVLDTGPGSIRQMTRDEARDSDPAWSPDGKRVAFTSNRSGNLDIWTAAPDGSDPVQVTRDRADDFDPAWSPDGKQIAYISVGSGKLHLWVADADGAAGRQVTRDPLQALEPSWGPDAIAFYSPSQGQWGLWSIEPSGANATRLTDGPADRRPSWSPDGGRIAFSRRTAGGESDLWVLPLKPFRAPLPLWAHLAIGLGLLTAGGLVPRVGGELPKRGR